MQLPNEIQSPKRDTRKSGLAAAVCALLLLSACSDEESAPEQLTGSLQPGARLATWAVSPQDYNQVFPGGAFPPPMPMQFDNQSLRQIMRVSVGGTSARVRLSNLFGTTPLTLDGARIARSLGGSSIDAASDTALTVNGRSSFTLAVGQEVWSDPSTLDVQGGEDVAVTLFFAGTAPVATVHTVGQQTQYVTAGDALSAASFDASAETRTSYYFVTGIDVATQSRGGLIVAFGDSITDGVGSTLDANHRYPNYLAERVRADTRLSGFGVIDEGISGNRVLNDVAGPAALTRFRRDVIEQPGATHVVILIGINDLGFGGFVPDQAVGAEDVTRGLGTLVSEAQGAGLDVFLGTLLPLAGTMAPYYSERTEMLRGMVNGWIRNEAMVEGVIDFDQAMQDGANPLAMDPAYDSSDHLHPNDAGYEVMGNAIDLTLFR